MTQYRQGDVFIEEISEEVAGKAIDREDRGAILAHGEVTGHAHAIKYEGAQLYQNKDILLDIKEVSNAKLLDNVIDATERFKTASLTHEEHSAIPLQVGKKYRVVRQLQEKDDMVSFAYD